MSRPRITFVSHDASRTGAPLLLLDLIRWLRSGHRVDPNVLCLRGGPLEAAFAAEAPTTVVAGTDDRRRPPREVVLAGLEELGAAPVAERVEQRRLRRALDRSWPADLLWLSAAPSLAVLPVAPPTVRVVAHIHELDGVLAESLPAAALAQGLRRCDAIVVGADPVAEAVVRAGAPETRVHVRDEFVPIPGAPRREAAQALRERLAIPAGAVVVGGIGTASWRKGLDLFVLLARMLRDRPETAGAHFVWVGGRPDDLALAEARHDVEHAGLADRVHLLGEQADLEPAYALFDVFVLTSREDSFPLVCLHAAARSIPVVAFDSGIGDLLRRAGEGASAIQQLDPTALAQRVAALVGSPAMRADAGSRLAREVRRRHVTGAAAPALFDVALGVLR